jgi:predicted DNA-binding protein YlxM (UPF0122 family)
LGFGGHLLAQEEEWLPISGLCKHFSSSLYLKGITDFLSVPLFKDKSFLHQKYVIEQLSTKEIAREILSSRSTIAANLKSFGIPLRTTDEAHKLSKGQLGYGERRIKRQVIDHKRELDNLKRMAELRDQGLSYWRIASIFNTMGIPTKNKGQKWHATTVMKIIKKTLSIL